LRHFLIIREKKKRRFELNDFFQEIKIRNQQKKASIAYPGNFFVFRRHTSNRKIPIAEASSASPRKVLLYTFLRIHCLFEFHFHSFNSKLPKIKNPITKMSLFSNSSVSSSKPIASALGLLTKQLNGSQAPSSNNDKKEDGEDPNDKDTFAMDAEECAVGEQQGGPSPYTGIHVRLIRRQASGPDDGNGAREHVLGAGAGLP
jgi:hypothetical protein